MDTFGGLVDKYEFNLVQAENVLIELKVLETARIKNVIWSEI